MKKTAYQKIVTSLCAAFFCLSSYAATESYEIDPKHTQIIWKASHFGFSSPSGQWRPEGVIVLDEKKPENSKVEIIIPIDKISTGFAEFDEHLKAPLFFDAKKFPTAKFVSKKVTKTGDKTAQVEGMLTIKDVSKPVTLDVTFNKKGINIVNDKMTVGFSANTKIKRSDFGMKALLPGIGDEVTIHIEAEGIKKPKPKKE